MQPEPHWIVDPDDPRAPPQELWDRMADEQRLVVVAALPSEFPVSEAHPPPEGDPHIDAWVLPRQTLRRWSKRGGRGMYVGGNMAVYYPGERMFSPDLFAVLDVPDHSRDSWIVSAEGRGLDLCLEVVVKSKRRKDFVENAARYARLGIREYFVLDWRHRTLHGHRLASDAAATPQQYQRMVPQGGRLVSEVLGLDLFMDGGRLRFAVGDAVIPDTDELVGRLEGLVTDALGRAEQIEAQLHEEQRLREEEQRLREEEQRLREEEQRLREEEQRLREEEQRRREELEQEVKALREEVAELRVRQPK